MTPTEFTARKLTIADQAAQDRRLTHLDFRLLWVMLSAADRRTGICRRYQTTLARAVGVTTRGFQKCRDRLVAFNYIAPIQKPGSKYIGSYNMLTKANLHSPSEGEPAFASENRIANSAGGNGEPPFQKREPSFVQSPLETLVIPSDTTGTESSRAPLQPAVAFDARPHRQGRLGEFEERLRQRLGDAKFGAWLGNGEAEIVEHTAGAITIAVKNQFFANQITDRFEGDIAACADVEHVKVVVRQSGGGGA